MYMGFDDNIRKDGDNTSSPCDAPQIEEPTPPMSPIPPTNRPPRQMPEDAPEILVVSHSDGTETTIVDEEERGTSDQRKASHV